jgi:uncharacterized membrane protein YhaH (DUF805 family)
MATLARHHRALAVRRQLRARRRKAEWPLWLQVVVLYGSLALIVGFVIALCFVIAWLATGSAT